MTRRTPALDGKTPYQAVKIKDGREMVEASLLDLEQGGKQTTLPLAPTIVTKLYNRLGLQIET